MERNALEFKMWYLGGPMSGYPDFNFPAFEEALETLTSKFKLRVMSAHKVDHGVHTGTGTQDWEEYMKGDIRALIQCDGAVFLQGWPDSKGARMEFDIANDLGYPIYQYMPSGNISGTLLLPLTRVERF